MEINEDFIKRHWFQLGILAIGFFIAWTVYNALVIQPEKNRQVEAQQKAEVTLAEEAKETERKENLTACLDDARTVYDKNWNNSCRTLGRLTERCEVILFENAPLKKYLEWHPELSDKGLLGQLSALEKAKEDCSCGLPTQTANRWDSAYGNDKNSCDTRYGK